MFLSGSKDVNILVMEFVHCLSQIKISKQFQKFNSLQRCLEQWCNENAFLNENVVNAYTSIANKQFSSANNSMADNGPPGKYKPLCTTTIFSFPFLNILFGGSAIYMADTVQAEPLQGALPW